MNKIVDRITSLISLKSMTAKELTEKLNVNKSTISEWKIGKTKPSVEAIIGISQIFNVSLDWLLTGEEKIRSIIEETDTKPLETPVPFEEKMLLNNYRELIEESKEKLIETAILLRTEQNNKHNNNKQEEKNKAKSSTIGFIPPKPKPLQLDPTPEDTEVTEELTPAKADLNFCQYQTYMNRIKK